MRIQRNGGRYPGKGCTVEEQGGELWARNGSIRRGLFEKLHPVSIKEKEMFSGGMLEREGKRQKNKTFVRNPSREPSKKEKRVTTNQERMKIRGGGRQG